MAQFTFTEATKFQALLRLALVGPAGSGKTYSALEIATHISRLMEAAGENPVIRLIDTERKSASKYADKFKFQTNQLTNFEPRNLTEALNAAATQGGGCGITIVDGLSPFWQGKDGALQQVDAVSKRSSSKNSFDAWRNVTPMHNAMVDSILDHPTHLIATMRTKTEYVVDQVEMGNGKFKSVPRKIGVQPVQRDGLEYEFDIIGDMNYELDLVVGKTRCSDVAQQIYNKPGREFATIIYNWLNSGAARPPEEEKKPQAEAEAVHPQAARIRLPKFKEIFDQLGVTEANRLAAADKYRADDKLLEVINRRLAEKRAQTTPPPAAASAAAAEPPTEGGPK
jgi:hypothetical protein